MYELPLLREALTGRKPETAEVEASRVLRPPVLALAARTGVLLHFQREGTSSPEISAVTLEARPCCRRSTRRLQAAAIVAMGMAKAFEDRRG